jgi:transposase
MVYGIELRGDFDAASLRRLARRSKDGGQSRRLLALAEIYAGGTRSAAAAIGGVRLQCIRDWVLRFNEHGPEGLVDRPKAGRRRKLTADQRQALKATVERGPIPAVDGVVRWRLIDLVQWLSDEFSVSLDETTVGRELKAMGFRKLTARPRHYAQNEYAVEAFKKTSPRKLKQSARD